MPQHFLKILIVIISTSKAEGQTSEKTMAKIKWQASCKTRNKIIKSTTSALLIRKYTEFTKAYNF